MTNGLSSMGFSLPAANRPLVVGVKIDPAQYTAQF